MTETTKPLVSICTPTFNRRPFLPILIELVRKQTWPRTHLEWVIVDDGTDKIQDILTAEAADLQTIIRYFPIDKKMTLGAKRNCMHDKAQGSILVYMDDDDYYPPERIQHAVETLLKNPQAICAGSSLIHVFFPHIQQIIQFGPYGPNHATAGTFAFRRELLQHTRYDENACLAEESHFLKNYTFPMVQLNPMKTILVFSHRHNSFDKKKVLANRNQFVVETTKTVLDFIQKPEEEAIRKFFKDDLDGILASYPLGEPIHKPDVLKQTAEMEAERQQMTAAFMAASGKSQQPIPVFKPPSIGAAPTLDDAIKIIKNNENTILKLQETLKEKEEFIVKQKQHIDLLTGQLNELRKNTTHSIPFIEPPRLKKSIPS